MRTGNQFNTEIGTASMHQSAEAVFRKFVLQKVPFSTTTEVSHIAMMDSQFSQIPRGVMSDKFLHTSHVYAARKEESTSVEEHQISEAGYTEVFCPETWLDHLKMTLKSRWPKVFRNMEVKQARFEVPNKLHQRVTIKNTNTVMALCPHAFHGHDQSRIEMVGHWAYQASRDPDSAPAGYGHVALEMIACLTRLQDHYISHYAGASMPVGFLSPLERERRKCERWIREFEPDLTQYIDDIERGIILK